MNELRKAAEQALKRLDMYFVEHGNDDDFEATQALRQALNVDAVNMSQERVDETRKGEHIKCIVKNCQNHIGQGVFVGNLCKPCHDFLNTGNGVYSQAYRNTKKEWVGLSDEEKYDVLEGATGDGGRVYYDILFRSYEAKLKEKNGG